MRKKCYSDREKVFKSKAEGQEFAKILRSLEQFIQKVKGQNNFETEYFLNFLSMYWRFKSDMMPIQQLKC